MNGLAIYLMLLALVEQSSSLPIYFAIFFAFFNVSIHSVLNFWFDLFFIFLKITQHCGYNCQQVVSLVGLQRWLSYCNTYQYSYIYRNESAER